MNHSLSYIICATPRSGTTLLTDLLSATGVAGQPDSFFRLQSFGWWADYLNVPNNEWADEVSFDRKYLTAVLEESIDATKIFGMRLMWRDFANLSNRLAVFNPGLLTDISRFETAFGPIRFVHLSRQDKVAQAVSRVKAEQSGLWHVDENGLERERLKSGQPPVYDAAAIAEQVAECEVHDAAWVNWFDQQKLQPVKITYEALSDNPRAILGQILSALGQDRTIARMVEPKTRKLADDGSREWASRFRAEGLV